ncbi:MAG: hypothetical protein OQK24_12705 [Magnetovibrio sp.]|nr:hypothetical protein [Magnetovibrio sp.]
MINTTSLGPSQTIQDITPQIQQLLNNLPATDFLPENTSALLVKLKNLPNFSKAILMPGFKDKLEKALFVNIDCENELLLLKSNMLLQIVGQEIALQHKSDEGDAENTDAKNQTDVKNQDQGEASNNPEDEASVEDDVDEDEEDVPGIGLIGPLLEHSVLGDFFDFMVTAKAIAPLYAFFCLLKIWTIKTILLIKNVLGIIRLLLGIEALVMLIAKVMGKNPNHLLTISVSTLLDVIKLILAVTFTILMVISKPHKFISQIFGEDLEEMLGSMQP